MSSVDLRIMRMPLSCVRLSSVWRLVGDRPDHALANGDDKHHHKEHMTYLEMPRSRGEPWKKERFRSHAARRREAGGVNLSFLRCGRNARRSIPAVFHAVHHKPRRHDHVLQQTTVIMKHLATVDPVLDRRDGIAPSRERPTGRRASGSTQSSILTTSTMVRRAQHLASPSTTSGRLTWWRFCGHGWPTVLRRAVLRRRDPCP